jgi:CO/xanthine dehydrogenase FAD-binding subunit
VKPAPFEYHAPESLDAAINLLATLDDAKVLAGGQSLVPLLNFRLARFEHLVDINRLPGLDRIEERDGLLIGALVRQAEAEHSPLVDQRCRLLRTALKQVAHDVIRNRGTVVGSIAHADPAAELPAVLLALGGHVVAQGPNGARTIEAGDFFKGVLESALEHDEIATHAWFPAHDPGAPHGIAEESRRHGDYAMAGAVRSGERLALFGVAPTTVLADARDPTGGLHPSPDLESSSDFKLHLVTVLTRRLFAS